jgi:hypothetical protein
MRKQFLVFSVTVLLAAVSAQASVVSYTVALAPNPQPTNVNTTLSLPQFDPSLGTLTGVQITVNGSLAARAEYENTNSNHGLSASEVPMQLNLTQNLTVGLGAQTLLAMTHTTAQDDYSPGFGAWLQNIDIPYPGGLTAYDGTTDYAGTSGFATSLWNTPGSATYSPATIGTFVGAGTFQVSVDATAFVDLITYGGNNSARTTSLAGTSVTVAYQYTPEPATMSLLVLGGLAMLRRKQN